MIKIIFHLKGTERSVRWRSLRVFYMLCYKSGRAAIEKGWKKQKKEKGLVAILLK